MDKDELKNEQELFLEYQKCKEEFEMPLLKSELPLTSKIINEMIEKTSIARRFFTVEYVQDRKQAVYPLPDMFESPTWILPGIGYKAQDYLELISEEVFVRMFSVQAAKEWNLDYEHSKRTDILQYAVEAVAKAVASYETESAWRVIIPAVTSKWDGAGVLPPRPAPIVRMPSLDPAMGYFSKELINRMFITTRRLGLKLTELLVSPEDKADVREWPDDSDRKELLEKGTIWGIKVTELDELGVRGLYNINDRTSNYGMFKGSTKDNTFNDYFIEHGNIVDPNGNPIVIGETQIYGLCEGHKDVLRMPVIPYEAHYDWSLIRRQRAGFFGCQKMGLVCLDARYLVMGVIDRGGADWSLPGESKSKTRMQQWVNYMAKLLRWEKKSN
jgi:hypothetical protein